MIGPPPRSKLFPSTTLFRSELDKQGRILLPTNLRDHAQLQKDVFIIGVSSRLEIWSKEVWEDYSSQAEASYEELAEKMVDFDIGF